MTQTPARRAHIAVVGGGLLGRATAWQLGRAKTRGVVLLEARGWRHTEGSSHGAGRVFRSTYADPLYIELCTAGRADWTALERASGEALLTPREAVIFGPASGPIEAFAEAMERTGAPVQTPSLGAARSSLDWLHLHDGDRVLVDPTAAVIAAAPTLATLLERALALGVHAEAGRPVLSWQSLDQGGFRLETPRGPLYTDRLVLCPGPGAASLLPELEEHLEVIPQLALVLPEVPQLPTWAWIGRGDEPEVNGSFYYGLENGRQRAHKVAMHDLRSRRGVLGALPEADPLAFWRWRLRPPPGRAIEEACRYTARASEDLIIGEHPEHPGLIVGAGLSGHGFKFGPVLGRILSALARDEPVDVEAWNADRARLSVPGREPRGTQRGG